jgi:hypothetical protein
MSTLKVSAINNAAASSGGLAIDSSGVVTGGLPSPNRNLLYNGAMQVAQRGTSSTTVTSGYFTADRWYWNQSGSGADGITRAESIESDAPSGSGFRKSLKVLITAGASISAGTLGVIQQSLEGQDVQRIAKGTSDAQQLTLSFWVKSNVTGTYICELTDADNTRSVSASYSVSASGTWEKKTITFPADTTGAFDNDNALSLTAGFWLYAGTTYTSGTLATTWASTTSANRAVGQTSLAAATNNYWQITGVQLEVGPTATGFEFKSYGTELAECQRYYVKIQDAEYIRFGIGFSHSTTAGRVLVPLPVTMRATPSSMDTSGTAANYAVSHGSDSLTALSAVPSLGTNTSGKDRVTVQYSVSSGLTAGGASTLIANNTTSAYLGFSAEL